MKISKILQKIPRNLHNFCCFLPPCSTHLRLAHPFPTSRTSSKGDHPGQKKLIWVERAAAARHAILVTSLTLSVPMLKRAILFFNTVNIETWGEFNSPRFYSFCSYSHFLSFFIYFYFSKHPILPCLRMTINRNRKQRSNIEAEKEIITWTAEIRNCKIWDYYRLASGVRKR